MPWAWLTITIGGGGCWGLVLGCSQRLLLSRSQEFSSGGGSQRLLLLGGLGEPTTTNHFRVGLDVDIGAGPLDPGYSILSEHKG